MDIQKEKKELSFRKTFKTFSRLTEDAIYDMDSQDSLRKTRHDLQDEMKALLARVETDRSQGVFNEEQERAWQHAEFLIEEIDGEIERRIKHKSDGPIEYKKFRQVPGIQYNGTVNPTKKPERTTILIKGAKSYRQLHYGDEKRSLDRGQFESSDDFFKAVASNRADPRLQTESRTFTYKSGSEGGFLMPEEWTAELYDKSLESQIVMPRCAVYPMKYNTLHVPAWKNSDHASNLYGGYTAEWKAENTEGTVQTGQLRTIELNSHKLVLYTEVSREALADGINFEIQIGNSMTKSLAYFLDESFLTGSGVGRPQGILNSPALVKVNRAGTTSIAYADIVNMFSRLAPALSNDAVWIANHSCLPKLLTMKDDSSALVWQPVNQTGVAGAITMTLFGKSLLLTEKNPSIGGTGDLMLCSLSEYAVGMRQEIFIENSNAPGWTRDVQSFRSIVMCDGQGLWESPVTPRDGSTNTLSCFVALSSQVG